MFIFPSRRENFLGNTILSSNTKMHPQPHPPPPPPPPHPPPAFKQTRLSPLYQIVLSKQALDLQSYNKLKSREQQVIQHDKKTKPIVWCGAILCSIFSLLLIFFSIAILIVFLVIKPRTPTFDTPDASLSAVYINSPQYLRSQLTFLANFSNPNGKLSVRYEHVSFEFYFLDTQIATQVFAPFGQKRRESNMTSVRLTSGLVYLPPNLAVELQKQEKLNRVVYILRGNYKVRFKLGVIRYSYWLHAKCQIEMTSPPVSVLITHQCRTTR